MPTVLFNVEGYWDGILKWTRDAVSAGFIAESNAGIMVEAKTGDEVIEQIRTYQNAAGRFKLQWNQK